MKKEDKTEDNQQNLDVTSEVQNIPEKDAEKDVSYTHLVYRMASGRRH